VALIWFPRAEKRRKKAKERHHWLFQKKKKIDKRGHVKLGSNRGGGNLGEGEEVGKVL